jgi:hypothetical protein
MKLRNIVMLLLLAVTLSASPFLDNLVRTVHAAPAAGWTMAGANPQRTSWTPDEAPGDLNELWIRPLESYVSMKVQVIAADGRVYVSTADGLYAFRANDGAQSWVYPTELPLGHSPTYADGVLYVGGLDRKIHAIDAATGLSRWTYSAEAGFHTNPLIIDGVLYSGDRGGTMYAVNTSTGLLKWKFHAGGQILQSAAYVDGVLFFGAMDGHVYALNAIDGQMKWKSEKMPGMGWHSWWPVIYRDTVILVGSADQSRREAENEWLFEDKSQDSVPPGILGSQSGDWVAGTPTFDIRNNPVGKTIPDYYEANPNRRVAIVLDRFSGEEVQFDLDNDGKTDGAPVMWAWTHAGSAYPPTVGYDDVLYFRSTNMTSGAIPGAMLVGWKMGTPHLSLPLSPMIGNSGDWPSDEPVGISAGGNYVYWNLCCDRNVGGADISRANTTFPARTNDHQWRYVSGFLPPARSNSMPAGYHEQYLQYLWNPTGSTDERYHAEHGDTVGPAIYDGKLFVIRSNALIAFSPEGSGANAPILPAASIPADAPSFDPLAPNAIQSRLIEQVQKILDAGHLSAGYGRSGLFDFRANQMFSTDMMDYWHNPGDTLQVLVRAFPHLPYQMQTAVKTYLQAEFNRYPPYQYRHIGHNDGTSRHPLLYDAPPTSGSKTGMEPQSFYALWQYATIFPDQARTIFDEAKSKLGSAPGDDAPPYEQNAHIAALIGYLELEKLAGYPESSNRRTELNQLLVTRAENFTWDVRRDTGNIVHDRYYYVNVTAWNFMFLVPELGDYLYQNSLVKVQDAVKRYDHMAPYWFVGHNEEVQLENGITPYHQTHTLFQAKALILHQPYDELAKYLDAPIVPLGDLYYIDNLVAVLEAGDPPASTSFADVPAAHTYYSEIEALYQAGYTAGCGTNPLRYCPDLAMNRAESAVFVERGIHGADTLPGEPASQVFADLPLDSWAAKWADALFSDGYTAGCGENPLSYCPWQGHTRAEGGVFYLRMLHGADYTAPAAAGIFDDVPEGIWFEKWVEAAYNAGILPPCNQEPLRICPGDALDRGLAAYMMVQAKGLE